MFSSPWLLAEYLPGANKTALFHWRKFAMRSLLLSMPFLSVLLPDLVNLGLAVANTVNTTAALLIDNSRSNPLHRSDCQ